MRIISRQEAIKSGLKRYFTVAPCEKGHLSERYVQHGCVECSHEASKIQKAKKRRERRPELLLSPEEKKAFYAEKRRIREQERSKLRAKDPSNRKYINAAAKAWRERNQERAKALVLAWHAKNPDKRRVHALNRRRKLKTTGQLSKDIVQILYTRQRGLCACCSQPLGDDFHVDHIMPIALGGTNTNDNVQLLRSKCNYQKRAKHPVDFMQSRGFLL